MKLNEEEVYEIEKFLLEEDLISLDFYNEMLDHFINAIADFKSLGHSFNESFLLTRDSFALESFTNYMEFTRYKGVKALEMRHYAKLNEKIKSKRFWAPISLIGSKGGWLWLLGLPIYLMLGLKIGAIWAFGIIILVAVLLGASLLHLSSKAGLINVMRWYRFMISSLPKRKKAQLKPNYRLSLVLNSFKRVFFVFLVILYLYLPIFYNDTSTYGWDINILKLSVAYLFLLVLVDFWNQFKLEFKKIQH